MDEIFLYLMVFFYVAAGIMHFIKPKLYIRIIPPYIPNPLLINKISGMAEIILGLGLLFETTRSLSAFGIIILLIAVFTANLFMYQKQKKGITKRLLFWRLPLQLVLIGWAYMFT
jgi:uncharacterized membrane protein